MISVILNFESLDLQWAVEVPDAASDQAMRDFMSAQGKSVAEEPTLKPCGIGVEYWYNGGFFSV